MEMPFHKQYISYKMSAVQDTIKVAEDQVKVVLFHLNEARMQDQRRIARETEPLHTEIRMLRLRIEALSVENESLRTTQRTVHNLTTLPR